MPHVELPDVASASSGAPANTQQNVAPATPVGIPPKATGVSFVDEVNTLNDGYQKAVVGAKELARASAIAKGDGSRKKSADIPDEEPEEEEADDEQNDSKKVGGSDAKWRSYDGKAVLGNKWGRQWADEQDGDVDWYLV